jgi:hypothetical protein
MNKNKIIEMYPVANDTFSNVEFRDRVVGTSTPSKDRINPALLQDVQTAASKAGIQISITTAVSGHKKASRHGTGNAVDIAMINNQGWSNERVAKQKGIYDDIERFVSELEKLGYKKNVGERGNPKVVLTFGFKNHHHHVHVSNTTNSSSVPSTEVEPTTTDISKVDLENLTKNMDNVGSDFKRGLLKKLLGKIGWGGLVDLIPDDSSISNKEDKINFIKNKIGDVNESEQKVLGALIEDINRIKNLIK